MTDTLRIYVACLASYNNGVLHGEWFDLEDFSDAEALHDAVQEEVLTTSEYPNVEGDCPRCGGDGLTMNITDCARCIGTGKVPSAEEWAIHDYEGFPRGSVSEYSGFDSLYEYKERLEEAEKEFGDDYAEIMEAFQECFSAPDAPVETIRDAYVGKYDSGKAFSEERAYETGRLTEEMLGDCDFLHYIDWERVWECNDTHSYVEHEGHFFYRDW